MERGLSGCAAHVSVSVSLRAGLSRGLSESSAQRRRGSTQIRVAGWQGTKLGAESAQPGSKRGTSCSACAEGAVGAVGAVGSRIQNPSLQPW